MPATTVVFVNGVSPLSPEQVRRGLDSPLASVRLRCLLPAIGLRRRGYHTALVSLPELGDERVADQLRDPALRIVLGKLSPGTLARHAGVCAAAFAALDRLADARTVHADVCDLLSPDRGHVTPYRDLALGRCRVIASTGWLAAHYAPQCRYPPAVAEDPTESPAPQPPRFAPGETLRLAWYGNWTRSAAHLVATVLADLADLARPLALEVVTQPEARADIDRLATAARSASAHARHVGHRTWSVAATAAAVAAADLVLLPQETDRPWGLAKSHNRLVEAIQQGRLAVASPIPAYQELAAGAWIGERLADGVRWALAHPAEAVARIAVGQAEVARRFSLAAVAGRWAEALDLPPA